MTTQRKTPTLHDRISQARPRGSLYLLRRKSPSSDITIAELSLTLNLQTDLNLEFASQASDFEPSDFQLIPFRPFDDIGDEQRFELPLVPPDSAKDGEVSLPRALYKVLTSGDAAPIAKLSGSPAAEEVRALAWVVDARKPSDAIVVFQVMERTQVLQNRIIFSFGRDDVYQRLDGAPLVLGDKAHAVYANGRLIFAKDFYVRRFIELSNVVRASTDEEVSNFYQMPCFTKPTSLVAADADQWIRRKVSSIRRQGNDLVAAEILRSSKKFGLLVTTSGKGNTMRIELPSDKRDLKTLLRFLDEDYYESWKGNRFQASTKRRL